MPNTYTKLYIHLIFVVKYRRSMINENIREPLHKYLTGILQKRKHLLYAIYAMPDHVHIFFAMHPDQALSNLARDLKANSAKYLNENGLLKFQFRWQEGFGAFSHSESQVATVVNYVMNQEKHHKKKSFLLEYKQFLDAFKIPYDERYIFKELE